MAWMPAPKYLLRRDLIRRLLRRIPPGQFIEFGSASGDIVLDLLKLGFEGTAVEVSPGALAYLRTRFAGDHRVQVTDLHYRDIEDQYDVVMALELLEHLEDDVEALHHFYRLLRTGGSLLFSVPARMDVWGPADEWAGHVRRYEWDELRSKLKLFPYQNVELYSYGWPITLVTDRMRHHIAAKLLQSREKQQQSLQERTLDSGIERSHLPSWLRYIFNDFVFAPAYLLQRCFPKVRRATAIVACARKQ